MFFRSSHLLLNLPSQLLLLFFFFNDTATTEIYTLSLHDALPIHGTPSPPIWVKVAVSRSMNCEDRKSTRLNSSHVSISYAVFCLKKKINTLSVFYESDYIIVIYFVTFACSSC